MQKMGYIFGTGLGKNAEGRIDPVTAVILPRGKSLGKNKSIILGEYYIRITPIFCICFIFFPLIFCEGQFRKLKLETTKLIQKYYILG